MRNIGTRCEQHNTNVPCQPCLMFDGFWGRFLVPSGVLRIVANSGSSLFVSPCGLMAVRVLGVLAEMGGRCSCVIAELNGSCSCVPGPSQAADLLCSSQRCDLFDHRDTHFSALGLLPVIISDGALGFAGPLEHVAAAALVSSGHSDLLVASAANAIEYIKESAAASVAAFLLDGQTDLLTAPAAQAFHFFEHQSVTQTLLQLQRQPRFWWRVLLLPLFFTCPSGAGLSLDSGLVVFFSGIVVKYIFFKKRKTCLQFRQGEETRMHIKKGAKNLVLFPTSRL